MVNGLCFIFLGTLGWGISLFLVKLLLVSLTPEDIIIYRMALGALFLFVLIKHQKIKTAQSGVLIKEGVVMGLMNIAIPFYLIVVAEKTVSSSLASIINGLTPLFTFLLGMIFYSSGQRFHFFNLLSTLLGLAGVVVINMDYRWNEKIEVDLFALIMASVSYAVAANYAKARTKSSDPIQVAAAAAVVSVLAMLLYKSIKGEIFHWHIPQNLLQVAALCWLGIIGSGLSLYLYCLLIQRTSAITASMITYLMTFTGIVSGVIFLQEKLTYPVISGCGFILASLVLLNHGRWIKNLLIWDRKGE
ncbi:DMT family transporter [Aquicella lusitana]|uniref:Drug/metabolite transporter (DMT)-like permease n=1 Tax=Aquicella lusitana TaxID=254246 RepID=A0A370GSD2_9COXI|nr:DMT family transporter [Aquicella lusitana]RDI44843.1 drug/metabolite transporter (DMT)-like permease [Aquicella lusitana]VVC73040.1 hypothetical protein AQULUS_07680 [Aquicella lusitana]